MVRRRRRVPGQPPTGGAEAGRGPIPRPCSPRSPAAAVVDGAAVARRFEDKTLLVIQTLGPFRYDFANSRARFEAAAVTPEAVPNHVTVARHSARGTQDNLFCKVLVIDFLDGPEAKAAEPAKSDAAAKPQVRPGDADQVPDRDRPVRVRLGRGRATPGPGDRVALRRRCQDPPQRHHPARQPGGRRPRPQPAGGRQHRHPVGDLHLDAQPGRRGARTASRRSSKSAAPARSRCSTRRPTTPR